MPIGRAYASPDMPMTMPQRQLGRPGKPRSSTGVSLIEVLVSLVILSLGMLAVVALQLVSKRNNADAGQRTIAAQLAYDIAERMRANASTATLPNYLLGATTTPAGALYDPDTTAPAACTSGSPCTAAQTVTRDLWSWEQTLKGASETVDGESTGGLVTPLGCIEQITNDGGGDGIYAITIVWRGSVQIPDSGASPDCGRAGEPGNTAAPALYGDDDEYRRVLSLPVYITARRA